MTDTLDPWHHRRFSHHSTGPEHDADSTGFYLVIESSFDPGPGDTDNTLPSAAGAAATPFFTTEHGGAGDVASIESPEFLVHNATSAVSFQYHMYDH